MIESSQIFQMYGHAHQPNWVDRYAKSLHPVRHWLYLMKLLTLGKLRLRGWEVYLNTPDRVILEDEILLFLAAYSGIAKVLFVGCDWYTQAYRKIFSQQEYWTIEPDANRAKYGAPNHIVDSLENLTRHFSENYFDLIVCNGILGYSLNTVAAANQAFSSCLYCLKPQGILIVGWNNIPESSLGLLSHCEALEQFVPYVFPAMSTAQCTTNTPNYHTFNFYKKPVNVHSTTPNPELS